ncbi:GNAT family N-acetyltransferase [Thorsellia anophelis]|uniref:Putative acetyltransferase n=1 Tax=Thorsellia anophelis DSM 18579 TaxID=1123402 RepID=A0A1I0DQ98_9GAMM|nr:GNAT family N-acetyltransferase [Thorsellia anophelis]SET34728.1 putative acetyltransferase [Thorsellia anophelis DSM 18579]
MIQSYTLKSLEVFYASVHSIDLSEYSLAQQQAWAALPINHEKWASRLQKSRPYYLTVGNKVAGFIEFDMNGKIDCFYVHPHFQRQKIAMQLYQYIENIAYQNSIPLLSVDASKVIKPLFEKQGFMVIKENLFQINDVDLINFTMQKILNVNHITQVKN